MLRASDILLENGQNLVVLVFDQKKDRVLTGTAYTFRASAVLNNLNLNFNEFMETTSPTYGKLGTESGFDFDYIGDTASSGSKLGNGDDQLRVTDSDPFWFMHFFPVPLNDTLRIYTRVTSSGSSQSPFEYDAPGSPDPTAGDPGWLTRGADLSGKDVKNPPYWLQHGSWYMENNYPFQIGGYNEDPDNKIRPAVNFKGKAYELDPVTDKSKKQKIIQSKDPRTVLQISGLRQATDHTPSAWSKRNADIPIEWDPSSRSMKVKGGGR